MYAAEVGIVILQLSSPSFLAVNEFLLYSLVGDYKLRKMYNNVNIDLISAVRDGNLRKVSELVSSYGPSYSPGWSDGYVLLRHAIQEGHIEIAKLLLKSGAKINSKRRNSFATLLHIAVKNDYIEIIEILLNSGAYVDAPDKYGSTAIHLAVINGSLEIIQFLLERGAHIDRRCTFTNKTPLHFAVEYHREVIVQFLLIKGANVNIKAQDGETPLYIAAMQGSEEIVKLLLSKHATVDAKTHNGITPLCISVMRGHEMVTKLLLQSGANVDGEILYSAVEKGSLVILDEILKYSPDLNNNSNRNALKIAVCRSGRTYRKIVESLLRYGVTVNIEDVNNSVLLFNAVENGYLKIIEDLLKYGANVNISINQFNSRKKYTLLHCAVDNKHIEIAKLLINYGAIINTDHCIKEIPLFYAVKNYDFKITKLLLSNGADIKDSSELLNTAVVKECREIVEILLQYGADINATNEYGHTALHSTALKDHLDSHRDPNICVRAEIAELLLSKGANINTRDKKGLTTFHLAAGKGYINIVEVLLKYKMDVNSIVKCDTPLYDTTQKESQEIDKVLSNEETNINGSKKFGTTALHIAIRNGNTKIVKILLKFGVDIDFKHKYGRTALHIACQLEHPEIIMILLEHGSDINIVSNRDDTPLNCAMTNECEDDFYDIFPDIAFDVALYNHIEAGGVEICQQHIIKMKIANLYVSEQNLSLIDDNDEINTQETENDFQNKCENEVKVMKCTKIGISNVSFYDILTNSISQLAMYAKNENIVEALRSKNYKKMFPEYASMINSNFEKGMVRRNLQGQGEQFFYSSFINLPELPCNCVDKILNYLSNNDLRILTDVCKPVNSTNT